VPADRDALQALPGVGRKTANVMLNTAFGQPTIAVDTHIFRVANRTGLAPGRNVEEVEQRLEKFVPDEFRQDCHHWLILHGRYVCTARAPKCATCVIVDLCEYRHKNLPAPVAPPRAPGRGRREATPATSPAAKSGTAKIAIARSGTVKSAPAKRAPAKRAPKGR
jgi:endonuclease-3